MTELAVNVSDVAALREIGKTSGPDPVTTAALAEMAGADGIVIHLREDRQFIKDRDIKLLREMVQTKMILEMASTSEMIGIALDMRPDIVTIVPEDRRELSFAGGVDLIVHNKTVSENVVTLQNNNIRVGILIEPEPEQVKLAHQINADNIEIYTGNFCSSVVPATKDQAFSKIVDTVKLAHKLRMEIHAGHGGLCYHSIKAFAGLSEIKGFRIGHSIISNAIFSGMENAVKKMIDIINSWIH